MDDLSVTFAALSDPTRRAILARLARGDARVGEIGQAFPISAPAISRHLRVLEQAGLIRREVDAQWRICRLQAPALQAAHGWLESYRLFWEDGLDRLTELVEQQHRDQASDAAPARAHKRPRPAARPADDARGACPAGIIRNRRKPR